MTSRWGLLIWTILAVVGLLGLAAVAFRGAALPPADLVIGNGPDPRSLDPALTQGIADGRILSGLFEGLVVADPETLEPKPGLAESWKVDATGTRYDFTLRSGLRFSDGTPLSAEDLHWSFLRYLDPKTAARTNDLLDAVHGAIAFRKSGLGRENVGIAAHGTQHLHFELDAPIPYFLDLLTLFPLYPVPRHAVLTHGEQWVRPEHFAGTGPYRLVTWRLRDRVRMERNPFYWDVENVHSKILDWLCVDSPTTLLNLYMTDRADIIMDVPTAAVPALRQKFGATANGEFVPSARLGTFFYRINTTRPPFTNARIRRALALAIDRPAIVENITRAGEEAAFSFVPQSVRAGDAFYEPPLLLEKNQALAKELLAEGLAAEGLKELPVFELLYSPDVADQAIAEFLQQGFSAIGVNCRLVHQDGQTIRDALKRLDYSVARSSWLGDYNDPSTFLDQYTTGSPGNRTGYSSMTYDRLIAEARRMAHNPKRRRELFAEAETLLLTDCPIVPVYHYVSRSLVKPNVRGFHRNVLDWHPPKNLKRSEKP